ncbi:hypothetical protein R8Z50_07940 [Longispora sp. K20-0274]|uniref:hypothetical protein n=1 Tax=Longispora sp. K20-0274 TaxID=3088255 RepID=UPI00399AFC9E
MRSFVRFISISAVLGAALATAACGSSPTKGTDQPTAGASPAASTGTAAASPQAGASGEPGGAGPCATATTGALAAVLAGPNADKANNPDVVSGLAKPVEFATVDCVDTWAMAWTTSKDNTVQPAGVLWRYLQASQRWYAQDLGTAIDCVGKHNVPVEVAKKLKGCKTS